MAPEYEKLIDIVKEKRDDVIVARLEGSVNEDISIIYEIFSFPKIVMFYPGSVDIKSNFGGQRLASVLFNWIEKNPKIEKQKLKMLEEEKPEVLGALNNVEKMINNLNRTKVYDLEDAINSGKNYTGEMDFLKIEMLNMKNRIINLEKDIEELKNHSINLVDNDNKKADFDNSNINQEDLAIKSKMIKEKKKMGNLSIFDNITTFDIFIYVGIVLFIIAAVITIKKILFKKNKSNISNDHAKV